MLVRATFSFALPALLLQVSYVCFCSQVRVMPERCVFEGIAGPHPLPCLRWPQFVAGTNEDTRPYHYGGGTIPYRPPEEPNDWTYVGISYPPPGIWVTIDPRMPNHTVRVLSSVQHLVDNVDILDLHWACLRLALVVDFKCGCLVRLTLRKCAKFDADLTDGDCRFPRMPSR